MAEKVGLSSGVAVVTGNVLDGFEPESLGPRRSTRLKDRPQPDYRFPVKPGFRKETGARPKEYSTLSNISGIQISFKMSPLLT